MVTGMAEGWVCGQRKTHGQKNGGVMGRSGGMNGVEGGLDGKVR